MPSVPHEMLVELLGKSPQLLPPLLGDRLARSSIAADELVFRRSESTSSQVPVLWADLCLELSPPGSSPPAGSDDPESSDAPTAPPAPVMALTTEIQLAKDEHKPYSWLAYLAGQHYRLRVPTHLLVVTNDPEVAAWAAGPFRSGHLTLEPWVLGPGNVPPITNVDEARKSLDMTLFSGIVHGHDPIAVPIGLVLRQVLDESPDDDDIGAYYWDGFLASLSKPIRKELEMQLPRAEDWKPRSEWGKRFLARLLAEAKAEGLTEGKAEGLTEGKAEGLTEGKAEGLVEAEAKAILILLEARGFTPSAKLRRRVTTCTDLAQLEHWLRKAATAKSLAAIFAREPRTPPSSVTPPR